MKVKQNKTKNKNRASTGPNYLILKDSMSSHYRSHSDVHSCAYCCTIHHSQEMAPVQITVWHIYAMEFQAVIKGKWYHDICKKKEATRNLYVKQNEPDTEYCMFSHVQN